MQHELLCVLGRTRAGQQRQPADDHDDLPTCGGLRHPRPLGAVEMALGVLLLLTSDVDPRLLEPIAAAWVRSAASCFWPKGCGCAASPAPGRLRARRPKIPCRPRRSPENRMGSSERDKHPSEWSLGRLYSNPDVRDIVAHAAQAVTHVKLDHYRAASPLSARRRWRLVDRLGEQIIRELLTDSRAGTPQRELAERYGISVSSVKRILRH